MSSDNATELRERYSLAAPGIEWHAARSFARSLKRTRCFNLATALLAKITAL